MAYNTGFRTVNNILPSRCHGSSKLSHVLQLYSPGQWYREAVSGFGDGLRVGGRRSPFRRGRGGRGGGGGRGQGQLGLQLGPRRRRARAFRALRVPRGHATAGGHV